MMSKAERAEKLGNALKQCRDQSRLTHADIAKKAGVSRQTLYCFENGKASPTLDTLARIAGVYGLQAWVLLAKAEI